MTSKSDRSAPKDPAWLIASKLKPSASAGHLVKRSALLEKLNAALGVRLTLVRAPAGFGKTTLLQQFYARLSEEGIAVCWLTLDEEDGKGGQFLAYLSGALVRAGILEGIPSPVAIDDANTPPDRSILSSLLNQLAATDRDIVLILDDYHRVQSAEVDSQFGFFIRHLSANVHLIVSSRETPGFEWTSCRTNGGLLDIGSSHLQFALEETGALVNGQQQKQNAACLSDVQVERLFLLTEGWVMGIQLASAWLTNVSFDPSRLDDYSGQSAEVADYLAEQVYRHLPATIQDFLVKTSVLERFNGDLCNEICDFTESWRIIEELECRNLFIFFLDKDREWARYHQLFSDFLQRKLRRNGHGSVEAIHRKAAEWFLQQGDITGAIHHALNANDADNCASIIDRAGGWRLAINGYAGRLRHAFAKIPDDVLKLYPRAWLAHILLSGKAGGQIEARAKLQALQVEIEGSPALQELGDELIAVKFLLFAFEDRLHDAVVLRDLERAVEKIGASKDLIAGILGNQLCALYVTTGRFTECLAVGARAEQHVRVAGNAYSELFVGMHMAQAHLGQGNLDEADTAYRDVYQRLHASFRMDDDLVGTLQTLLAETAYERDNLLEAQAFLEQSLPSLERIGGWFDVFAAGYGTAASLAHARHDIGAAMAVLDRAEELAKRGGFARLPQFVVAQRVRELTLAGQIDLADKFAERLDAIPAPGLSGSADMVSWRLQEAVFTALARLEIAKGNPDLALSLLQRLRAQAERERHVRTLIKLDLLQAMAQDLAGRRAMAMASLESCLDRAAPLGFLRTLLDEGEPMKRLLGLFDASRRASPVVRTYVARLRDDDNRPRVPLTARETQILALLVAGYSTKEMAYDLNLGMNTIKYHRRNVFDKLGVRSRSEAIAVARQRGGLPIASGGGSKAVPSID
ncbi:LuxR C-terminal-related transcriptional regulator [Sphingosinicella microcystinivorans]|uniref:LuxR C-terminal-related transcriptional regulator n=1 Tax=Sphingosinicella microcystinivorans TaxID=335406 RepID=UPI0022F3DE38|nr:LuxR C-terminal-related transcriptional regulator [Sphingosinicella microcystinivorans]WBX85596.1 LuxR C-terminal-related transcriptional regulator [Sphingosinicella microcystinivorans]